MEMEGKEGERVSRKQKETDGGVRNGWVLKEKKEGLKRMNE